MCRGEQWSSFLGQLLGLNEALSNGMDMCWGRRMVMLSSRHDHPPSPTHVHTIRQRFIQTQQLT